MNNNLFFLKLMIQLFHSLFQLTYLIIQLLYNKLSLIKLFPTLFQSTRIVLIKVIRVVCFLLQFLLCFSVLLYEAVHIFNVGCYIRCQGVVLLLPVVAYPLSYKSLYLFLSEEQFRKHFLSDFLLLTKY